ncbi:LuxR C-terminal-related transcriptional regulator [Paraclostridium bifermentans]|uniref:LuxR C-terminal-related transcriptional regulator n=1 Tax=Paraclostridium bifermentans TaxID=1490 RepID=A0ABY8R4J8_PARBF|nr:LuxR C-terminal-related transcriptional regulator [Paraclostridium bifermentans]
MKFLVKGLSNKSIAIEMDVTEYTIKKHVGSILSKLNLKNRQDMILYAIEQGKCRKMKTVLYFSTITNTTIL